jgi:Arc/MetJ-type ribon-helix-helix transcriptional regulator
MNTRNGMPRIARIAVRLSESEEKAVREAAKAKGYTSPSAFIRAAIRNEMDGRSEWTDFEQRLAAGIDRTNEEVSRVGRGQQAVLALLDALTKTVLTCIPEPPVDARTQAVARARERYDRLIKSAGRAMAGDGQAAIRELVTDAASQG